MSGEILANAQAAYEVTCSLANRLFGEKGPEFQQLVGKTILGVALIQSVFAALGFFVVGLPGATLWSVIFLLAAVLQAGGLVFVPAVIYIFATASTTKAGFFLIWCICRFARQHTEASAAGSRCGRSDGGDLSGSV